MAVNDADVRNIAALIRWAIEYQQRHGHRPARLEVPRERYEALAAEGYPLALWRDEKDRRGMYIAGVHVLEGE